MSQDPEYWSQQVKDGWFFAILTASTVAVAVLFWPYVYVLLFAAVTVVVCWPVYAWLLKRLGGRALLASTLTTVLLALLVFVPLALVLYLFALEVQEVSQYAIELVKSGELERMIDEFLAELVIPEWIEAFLPQLPDLTMADLGLDGGDTDAAGETDTDVVTDAPPQVPDGLAEATGAVSQAAVEAAGHGWAGPAIDVGAREALEQAAAAATEPVAAERGGLGDQAGERLDELLARLSVVEDDLFKSAQDATLSVLQFASGELPGIIQAAVDLSIDSVIYVFAVIVLFTRGEDVLQVLRRLSPLDDRYEERLFQVFREFSRNLVVGSIATAAIQGVVAGFGYAVAGLENVVFLAILTAIGSFVPVVGTVVVWIPVVIYLVVVGDWGYAIFLGTWSLVVVGTVDNVLKPLFMKGNTDIHPLLVFLAVFGGLYWMQLPGLLVGPVVVAFFLALYAIYTRDFLGVPADPMGEASEPGGLQFRLGRWAHALAGWLRRSGRTGAAERADRVARALGGHAATVDAAPAAADLPGTVAHLEGPGGVGEEDTDEVQAGAPEGGATGEGEDPDAEDTDPGSARSGSEAVEEEAGHPDGGEEASEKPDAPDPTSDPSDRSSDGT